MIFYFTATGNCLYAARRLQSSLGGQLCSIPRLLGEGRLAFTAEPGEYVGFVFPVYYWGPPHIVGRFVSRLQLTGAAPERTFVMATMGDTSGSACEQLEKQLFAKAIKTGYKFGIPMVGNYVPNYSVPTPEEAARKLDAADKRLEHAAAALLEGRTGDYNRSKGPLPVGSPLVYRLYPTKTGRFYADDECTGCGLCQRICPVGAIRIRDSSPVWVKERCETCLACLHRCPAGAIQRGKDQRGRGRYVNPRVTLPAGAEETDENTGEDQHDRHLF